MTLLHFAEWLENTNASIAFRESVWAYPVVEGSHVLGLGLFLGLTLFMDLRLLGAVLRDVAVGEVMDKLLPWIRVGFAVMIVTGIILVAGTPVEFYGNVLMRAKLVLLAIAGINVWVFHARLYPSVGTWGAAAVPPLQARIAGGVSLTLWSAALVAGRLLAYNWFD